MGTKKELLRNEIIKSLKKQGFTINPHLKVDGMKKRLLEMFTNLKDWNNCKNMKNF
jgi:hypothetical protein